MSKVTITRQTAQNECGLCCIAMVASYFGLNESIGYYRTLLDIGRDGMGLTDICSLVPKIGLNASAFKIENANEFEFSHKPYIFHLKNNHFVVVTCSRKQNVNVYDPAIGKYKIPKKEFFKKISGLYLEFKTTESFKKNNKKISDYRHLFPVVASVINILLIVIALSLTAYAFSVLIPLALKGIIDNVSKTQSVNAYVVFLQIVLLVISTLLFALLGNHFSVKLQVALNEKISYKTITKLFKIHYSFFDNRSQGDILYRISLLSQLQQSISNNFVQSVTSIACIITVFVYLSFTYSELILFLLLVLFVNSAIAYMFNLKILQLKRVELDAKKNVDGFITEIVNNMNQIKCMHLDSYFLKTYKVYFKNYNNKYYETEKKTLNYNAILGLAFQYLPTMVVVLLLIVPRYNYSLGEIFALFSILGTLFNQSLGFITQISSFWVLRASMFYLNDLLDEENQLEKCDISSTNIIESFNEFEIKDVSFRYNSTVPNVLNSLNFKIKKGENIAIVGVSGSGKTTLVKLLAKLYEPSSGSITINNVNIKNLDEEYNKIVKIVPQIPVFFNKTIKENIIMGNSDISDEQIIRALKISNFWDEVSMMPMGIETVVSGQGGNLSGGQIQKLSLSRALVCNPQLLILDEATSSLDPWNEKIVYNNLKETGITRVVISHRLSTIVDADCIYVMKKGSFVEVGTHVELIEKCGNYHNLYINEREKREEGELK